MPGPSPSVEERIEPLWRVGAFPPPSDFAAHAQVRNPAEYPQAAVDASVLDGLWQATWPDGTGTQETGSTR